MKKLIPILLTIFLIIIFTAGCSSNATQSSAESSETVSKSGTSHAASSVDLTSFDEITASDVAHRISENPKEYLGISMKVKGHYESADNYNTGGYIHSVVVSNDTQCCPAVIEFIWKGNHSYPKDYPKKLEEIQVEGIFKSYEEKGETYYYLAIDDISIL